MKTKLALIAAAVLSLAFNINAQTTNIADIPNTPEVKADFISFVQDTISNKSVTIALYPTYANAIKVDGKNANWGAGIALLTTANVIPGLSDNTIAQHAFGGLRFDLIGKQFFASTLALGLKGDMQLLGHTFTGFVESGANIPLTGSTKDGVVGAMAGAGFYTTIVSFGPKNSSGLRPGSLDAFAAGEKWTQFSGFEAHAGLAGSYNF